VWGIVDDTRVYRLTFSKSLAEMIAKDSGMRIQRFNAVVGRALDVDESSTSGVYGVTSKNNGVLLRVPLIQPIAEMYRDSQYRDIHEVYLERI
jgi:hypothetical protein